MKKIFLTIVLLAQCLFINAQTNLHEAVDFETVDMEGNPIHLFDILDGGQSVLIVFFFAECGGCQQTILAIAEAYSYYGCNLHELFVMGISYIDNDSVLAVWRDRYGVEMPLIGKEEGGNAIFSAFGVKVCPSMILIKPDHSIPIKSMFTFALADVENQLIPYDLHPSDCTVEECTVPSDLTAAFIDDVVTLVWNGSSSADYYAVYRNGEIIGQANDTFYVDQRIGENEEYCYYVIAVCDDDEESPPSNTACVSIPVNDTNTYRKECYTLFPNPAIGKVIVKGPTTDWVKVYDLLGRLVYEADVQVDCFRIDLSHCESGVYIVHLSYGTNVSTQRIVLIR